MTQKIKNVFNLTFRSQWDMVKVMERMGQNERLGLSGRPVRPMGSLGSSKVNSLLHLKK
jgi:hypothetical protein